MATAESNSPTTPRPRKHGDDLLVLVTPMAPEISRVLANLESAFSPDSFVVATQNDCLPMFLPVCASSQRRQANAAWSLKAYRLVNAARTAANTKQRAAFF